MSDPQPKTCIYPGCERPAVPPHPMGGPQPAFCDRDDHNALSAHLERKRLAARAAAATTADQPAAVRGNAETVAGGGEKEERR